VLEGSTVEFDHTSVLEILGYAPTKRRPIEILGYEHSPEGVARWLRERPPAGKALVSVIVEDLEKHGVFPPNIDTRNPPAPTTFAEKRASVYSVVEIEKPSLVFRSFFRNAEEAAEWLIGCRLDRTWVPDIAELPKPTRTESRLDPPE